ncbi:3-dehydroquinate synthase [Allohahella marinimesophila]|uniref:3-dehydroquinate synthase n=1 Tax=Allohahella marinimesophila TaxID=1054972 RepID=A0ABP7PU59_9GAMM
MKTLTVGLGDRSYPIYIGDGVMTADRLAAHIGGKQVMIVTNETVAPLYLEKLIAQLDGFEVDVTQLHDGEQFKTLTAIDQVIDHLLTQRHNRSTTLIALGGGVVGDITGFAASCYQRGVDFIQVPTTLLSQVDSSVGGKTGVNHRHGKNMIGAFYQPQAVLIDTSTLQSLPARELSAGLAEVVKYGLIDDPEFLDWLEANADALVSAEPSALVHAIEASCACKARVVEDDELEQGRRAILNLGHTFGHAIEGYMQYKQWLHGEAVAVGMVMAVAMSVRCGYLQPDAVERVSNLLSRMNLPVRPPVAMTPDDFMQYMAVDKKNVGGSLRLVLLQAMGDAIVTDQFDGDALVRTLIEYTTH